MSKKQKESKKDQRQFWQMAIETWQASGISVSKFCEAEGLSESSFYIWRKKLTASNKPENGKEEFCQPEPFIQVAMPKSKPVALELLLSSGNTLRIDPGTDNKTLTNVLSALCEAGLC